MKCFGIELYGLLWFSCLYDVEASATSVAISAASYQQTTAYYLRLQGNYQTIRCHNPEDHGIIHRTVFKVFVQRLIPKLRKLHNVYSILAAFLQA